MNLAYQAARSGAAYYLLPDAGCLRLEGPDRQAFLQRQTSNDVRRLGPGRGVLSVLTSPTARILDVLYLLPEEAAISILTLPGRSPTTTRFLRSRIFFNDHVSLVDASSETVQLDLFGPQAAAALAALGLAAPREVDQVAGPGGEWGLHAAHLGPFFGLGYRLLAEAAAAPALQVALEQAGAAAVDAATLDVLRVEAGLPAAGAELIDAYTPLEAGLEAAVCGSKGCYTGQEVLARQVTYDKVTQRLCGLRLEALAEPGTRLYTASGEPAGSLTSPVISPRLGAIGLGVVKRPHHSPGTCLRVGDPQGDPGGRPAVVSELPFE